MVYFEEAHRFAGLPVGDVDAFFFGKNLEESVQGGDTTKHAYVAGQLVVKEGPVDVGSEKLFPGKDQHGSGISEEIGGDNEKTDISPDAETGNETVEKDRLESKVGHIQTEALCKQPYQRGKLEPGLSESDNG